MQKTRKKKFKNNLIKLETNAEINLNSVISTLIIRKIILAIKLE